MQKKSFKKGDILMYSDEMVLLLGNPLLADATAEVTVCDVNGFSSNTTALYDIERLNTLVQNGYLREFLFVKVAEL